MSPSIKEEQKRLNNMIQYSLLLEDMQLLEVLTLKQQESLLKRMENSKSMMLNRQMLIIFMLLETYCTDNSN
jgi:hypothetical protein